MASDNLSASTDLQTSAGATMQRPGNPSGNHGAGTLAIHGGPPTKTKPVGQWPAFDDGELDGVVRVLNSQKWWRNEGNEVDQFEQAFAAYHNTQHALGVTNGTQAIEVALQALNIGQGDEVIVPAFTWISTASAVLMVGATPILADVDPDTYCLDPESVARCVTPRTRAILPVHMAGQAADMDGLTEIADQHGLAIIEDCAHAHGAEWRGRRVGALHTCGIFSFQMYKLMTAGEGGMIIGNDKKFLEDCFLYSNCGRIRGDRDYQHVVLGTNARMSELQGAVLRGQLQRLDDQIERRSIQANTLDSMLVDVAGLRPQKCDRRATRNPHYMFMFRYDAGQFGNLPRRDFVAQLVAEGFPAYVAYPAIHKLPIFDKNEFGPRWANSADSLPTYRNTNCPVSVDVGDNVVWLHHRLLLGDDQDLAELLVAIEKIRYHAT